MSILIQNLCRISNSIFGNINKSVSNDRNLNESLSNFIKIFSQISLNDLYLDTNALCNSRTNNFDEFPLYSRAPISFVPVYENNLFSLTVFGFRRRTSCIPLHDHPGMHAFMRCIYGSLAVKSYTILNGNYDIPSKILNNLSNSQYHNIVPAVYLGEEIVSSDSRKVCSLTPNERNLHEIRPCSNQMAIMVDIISPPYTEHTNNYFYNIIDTVYDANANMSITWLYKTLDSSDYYCDTVPYSGPSIVLN